MQHRSALARLSRAGAVAVLLATTLSAGISHASPAKAPVSLTFWSWVPNLQDEVTLFNQSHPDIKVNLVNAGQGAAEYLKLRTALKASSGAPDIVQIEFQYMPTFELTGKLVDLSQYGANSVQEGLRSLDLGSGKRGLKGVLDSAGQRSDGTAVQSRYLRAVPSRGAHHLGPVSQEAAALHKANPKLYMTEFAGNDGGWVNSLLWQAGVRPFKVSGTTLSIDINSPAAIKVANYWGDMVKAGVVSTLPDFTTAWYTGLANGTIASWATAGWGPVFLSGQAAKTTGKWRAAPLPQWTAGAHASGNWGGSTDAVTTFTKNPKEAAEFVLWLNDNFKSASMLASKQFLFPTTNAVLKSPTFDVPLPFYGGQKVNGIFAAASASVDLGFQWSPFQDYVYTQLQNNLADATAGKITFGDAMNKTQNTLVSYAKSQGFTVK